MIFLDRRPDLGLEIRSLNFWMDPRVQQEPILEPEPDWILWNLDLQKQTVDDSKAGDEYIKLVRSLIKSQPVQDKPGRGRKRRV